MLHIVGWARESISSVIEKWIERKRTGRAFWEWVTCSGVSRLRGDCSVVAGEGADVNAQGGPFGTPLQAVAAASHEEIQVVRLLLENGIDVNAKVDVFGSTVQIAASMGYKEIIRLLLKHGEDLNAQGEQSGSAIQTAALHGHTESIQLLLEHGAAVNAQGGLDGSAGAVQAAALKGHTESIRSLLKHRADVNSQGGPHGSPLEVAASEGHEETIRLLLEHGADVNAQGGPFGGALQAAASQGHKEIVLILLENGADVNAQTRLDDHAVVTSESDESVHHYLIHCPAYKTQRCQLERKLKRDARSLRTLLTRPKVVAPLFQYINATGRFRDTFGDVAMPEGGEDQKGHTAAAGVR